MSKYTTGEVAKLCGVSVRTVQYYDTRGVLVPSELSEGGHRLYSESDLEKMKIICFLRDLTLPIDSIKGLFAEENSEKIISVLLDEQERMLRAEISEKEKRADALAETGKLLSRLPHVSVEAIRDVARITENKKYMKRLRKIMLLVAFLSEGIEIATAAVWIFTGIWWPFLVGMCASAVMAVCLSVVYFRSTAFICPSCHSVFKPSFREAFFARHTPHTRKLTCTSCRHHGFCIETYGKERKNSENN